MKTLIKINLLLIIITFSILNVSAQNSSQLISKNGTNTTLQNMAEKAEVLYRPQIHFTPSKGWMNDPNGMFYKDGVYHLYFQHNPDSNVWGPMHWGHATSKNLINWKQEPIAIYPDSIGMIFSGSAVVDIKNTSGFGKNGKAPIVAIFTQHNMEGEYSGRTDFQNQSIAYSLDNGYTWKMYKGNPVIKNPGIKDFRDPKVIWHDATKKWIMVVAVKNKVSFYSSANLIQWTKESDFGEDLGNHDGVWECPDLFTLSNDNKKYWVLTSSINPGGPNKGSATQFFIGDFDGHSFKSNSNKTKWMDYGADNYAGVTWSDNGPEKISIGWMSNWIYAREVPTFNWRSATTLPRTLALKNVNGEMYLTSDASKFMYALPKKIQLLSKGNGKLNVPSLGSAYKISFDQNNLSSYTVSLSNDLGEYLDFGYDSITNQFFIDRTLAGVHKFNPEFAAKHFAPRLAVSKTTGFYAIVDKASIEFFADGGLNVMTDIFFPTVPYTNINIISNNKKAVEQRFELSTFLKN